MDLLLILSAVALLIAGVLIAVAGAIAPSLSEFLDRPGCWLFGHRLDRYLFPTTRNGMGAECWRCGRCEHVITLVGPYRRLHS